MSIFAFVYKRIKNQINGFIRSIGAKIQTSHVQIGGWAERIDNHAKKRDKKQ